MGRDIVISAGIKFNPQDIDTKAIKDAIVKTLANTELRIAKAKFSNEARTELQNTFSKIPFTVSKARIDGNARSSLQDAFSKIPFVVNNARFGATAINGLKNSFNNIQLTVGQAKLSASVAKGVQQASNQQAPGNAGGATAAAGNAAQTAASKFLQQNQALQQVLANTTAADRANQNYLKSLISSAGSAETFGVKIGQITTRFTAYLLALRAILGVQQAFSASLKFIFEFDSALQDLQKVIRETPEGLEQISNSLFAVSNRTARSFTEAASSLNEFVRSGLSIEDALKRTEAALIAVNVTGLEVNEATKLITSSLVIFRNELKDGIAAIDLLTIADEKAAASSAEIARGILRSGGAAESVGISFKQLNALIAGTIEATQLSGSTIGAALKTIFANLASNSQQLRENANAFGANIQAGDDLFVVLEKLAAIFPQLNKEQVAVLNQVIAGKRRFTELTGLLSNFGKVQEIVAAQNNAAGVALERNQVELQKLSARAQLAKNAFSELIANITGVGRGEEGIGSIRDILKESIDIASAFAGTINEIVKGAQEVTLGLFGVDTVLKTLIKAAFFTSGVQVIRGVVAGFKAFLSLSNSVTVSLQQNAAAQTGILRGVTQVTAAQQQALTVEQKRLQVIQQIQALIQKTRSAPIGQGVANPPTQQQGGITSQRAQFVAVFAASLAVQELGDVARETAKELKDRGDDFSANLANASASAAEVGTAIAFLAGPLTGVAVGLLTLGVNLISSNAKTAAASLIAQNAFEDISNRSVRLGEALSIGGELGREVFERLASNSDDLNESFVNAITFSNALATAQSQQADTLDKLVQKTGDFADSLTSAVEGLGRRLEIRKEFQKAAEDFGKRAAKLKFEIETGDVRSQVNPVRDAIVETNVQLEKFRVIGGEIEGQFTKIQRAMNAVEDAQTQVNKTSFQILVTNGLTTKEIDNLTSEYNKARDILIEQENALEKNLASTQGLLEEDKRRLDTLDSTIKKIREAGNISDENAATDVRLVSLSSERANIANRISQNEQKVQSINKNLETSGSKLTEISAKREDLAKEFVKDLVKAEQSFKQQVQESSLLTSNVLSNTKSLTDQANLLEKELTSRKQIATILLEGGTLAQRAVNEELAARENIRIQVQDLASLQEKEINQLKELQNQAIKDNQAERAKAIAEQINQLQQASKEELDAFERKLNLELTIDLIESNRKNVERAEQGLLDFRLRAIDQVADRQRDAIAREIDLVKQLGETVTGRNFLLKEFKPSNFDIREFGVVGSIIIKELETSTDIAVQAMLAKLDQLKTGGLRSFEDLRAAVENQKTAVEELNRLTKEGADPEKIQAARQQLEEATANVNKFSNSGRDAFEILSQAQQDHANIIKLGEEDIQAKREIILDRLKKSSEGVNKAEQTLIEARNKIPPLNAAVIEAEKGLAAANADVFRATEDLVAVQQAAADAQFRLNAEVSLAEFKARQAVGSFGGVSEQIGFLRNSFETLTGSIKASSATILEVRRQILQEELSLLQSQFNTVKSLAVEAATGGPEAASKIAQQISAAQAIARGASIGQFPPELVQGIERLFGVVDGLEQAITEQGLAAIGLPSNTLDTMGGSIIELSKSIAETGKAQVDQALEQVRLAQEALFKADEQKIIAEQELELSRSNREFAVKNASIAAENLGALRFGFRESSTISIRQLSELGQLREGVQNALARNNEIQNEAKNQITELLNVSREQLTVSQNIANRIGSISASTPIATAAGGTLTRGEFGGLFSAAQREKRAMPSGSRLMLANTSEVVLTRRQAKMIGLGARPVANAQNGNADFGSVSTAAAALTAATSALLNKLNQPGFVQQNISVQLDQNRKLEVRGLDGIDSAVRTAFEERMSRVATKEEQDAIAQVVQSLVNRLNEQGIVNTNGF